MNDADKKTACGYNPKPVLPTCGNCAAFASDRILPRWMMGEFTQFGSLSIFDGDGHIARYATDGEVPDRHKIETNMHCADQGFAVKKLGSCNNWRAKE